MPKENVREQINSLKIGKSVEFPLERYSYVVSCRTNLRLTTGKKFTCKIERDRNVVVVTRKKINRNNP